MKLFGWDECNECAYGITVENRDTNLFQESDFDENGELSQTHPEFPSSDQGRWFKTFAAAKKAQLEELEYQVKWMKKAIAHVRKLTKKAVQ